MVMMMVMGRILGTTAPATVMPSVKRPLMEFLWNFVVTLLPLLLEMENISTAQPSVRLTLLQTPHGASRCTVETVPRAGMRQSSRNPGTASRTAAAAPDQDHVTPAALHALIPREVGMMGQCSDTAPVSIHDPDRLRTSYRGGRLQRISLSSALSAGISAQEMIVGTSHTPETSIARVSTLESIGMLP